MNIPVVASKKSNEEDGLGLCFALLCEKGKVYALDFEISGGRRRRRRCESRHFCFSKESFKGGGYARAEFFKTSYQDYKGCTRKSVDRMRKKINQL